MHISRRIAAIILAGAMAVSPALACKDFCPERMQDTRANAAETAMNMTHMAMAAGARDNRKDGAAESRVPAPDCAGSPNCLAAASFENKALTAGAAISIEAPVIVFLSGPFAAIQDDQFLARGPLTPPAIGPPPTPTPVSLNNILRI